MKQVTVSSVSMRGWRWCWRQAIEAAGLAERSHATAIARMEAAMEGERRGHSITLSQARESAAEAGELASPMRCTTALWIWAYY
jgi:hypothetical protein